MNNSRLTKRTKQAKAHEARRSDSRTDQGASRTGNKDTTTERPQAKNNRFKTTKSKGWNKHPPHPRKGRKQAEKAPQGQERKSSESEKSESRSKAEQG